MAGAGWRDFVPGEVLTAANVQDYLQDQAVMSFASAAARTSAIGSPTDGMVSYLKDTDRIEVYTGSAWVSYTPGLIPISPTSVAQAGGSASANTLGFVTFNGCTSVSLNGVFTSDYNRYRIVFEASLGSTTNMHMRMRATTDDSSANYYTGSRRDDSSGVGAAYSLSAQTYWVVGGGAVNWAVHASLDIYEPQVLSSTRATIQASGHTGSHTASYAGALALNTNTAYDGFTLYPAAGSSTGSIQVFGYND